MWPRRRTPAAHSEKGRLIRRTQADHDKQIAEIRQQHAETVAALTARISALEHRTAYEVRRLHSEVSRANGVGARVERRVTAIEIARGADEDNARAVGDLPQHITTVESPQAKPEPAWEPIGPITRVVPLNQSPQARPTWAAEDPADTRITWPGSKPADGGDTDTTELPRAETGEERDGEQEVA